MIRKIRRVVLALTVLAGGYLYLSFGLARLTDDNDSLHPFAAPGAAVLVEKLGAEYKVGRYVFYRLTWQGGDYLASGKIYAGPGDTIRIADNQLKTEFSLLPLTGEQLSLWKPLDGTTLGEGEYLIANENLLSQRPDARSLGPVAADRLISRILIPVEF